MARILYFSREYTPHDHRFLTALSHTEHQLFYMCLEQRGHALEDRPLPPGVSRVNWAGGNRPVHRQDAIHLLFDMKRVLRSVQPDLVQAGPLQTAALLVALAGFRPLVSMSWGYDLLIDAQRDMLWCWATRYTLQQSAVLVGDCETIRKRAEAFGMPAGRIITFPWGIDLQHFSPLAERPENATFTLLSTRSWEPIYGIDVLARAFVTCAQTHPELRLIMLGNGSQAAWLRATFERGGVSGQVYFPGQVSQNELPRCYRGADLYLSASHSDGTSISLLEALACGCPDIEAGVIRNQLFFELAFAHVAVVQFKAVLPDRGVGRSLKRNILYSSVV